MIAVRLADEADVEAWRRAARALRLAGVTPDQVVWRVGADGDDLFADGAPPPPESGARFNVPRAFLDLVDLVIRHNDAGRFDLLYRLLFRLSDEPHLLAMAADPDVRRATSMARAVRRDRHKMTAFVRFREVDTPEGPRHVAWFEPEHFIEEHVAPFFVDRFAAMAWTILTPRRTIDWSDGALSFLPGAPRSAMPKDDDFAAAWNVYYASTFNPARVKPAAMRREMAKKYWPNLPETRQIPALLAAAPERVNDYLDKAPAPAPAHHAAIAARRATESDMAKATPGERQALAAIRAEAEACRRCDLWKGATQTVFGEGPLDAAILFVGEQPGDQEDLAGRPFVGPAGKLFDRALAEAGVDRASCYVTNAVKHFKNEPRGKRRIHQKPNAGEVTTCRWWLDKELALVSAPIVVALGATAALGLTGKAATISAMRGRAHPFGQGRSLYVTVHPSYLLRLPDAGARAREERAFVEDLRAIGELARAA